MRISDPRSLRSWKIKWTDDSTLDKNSSVHLIYHDPSGLGTPILVNPYHPKGQRTPSDTGFCQTVHRPNTTTPYPQVQLSLESSQTQATRHCTESNLIKVVSSISFQSGIWNVWGRHQGCSCGAVIPKSVEEQSVWELTEYACWVSNVGNPISVASPCMTGCVLRNLLSVSSQKFSLSAAQRVMKFL